MYWNWRKMQIFKISVTDKLQHEMYWNIVIVSSNPSIGTINYNMRCIETYIPCVLWNYIPDKLQHEMYWNKAFEIIKEIGMKINYNMRCIETRKNRRYCNGGRLDKLQHEMYWNIWTNAIIERKTAINYNMRCIETLSTSFLNQSCPR